MLPLIPKDMVVEEGKKPHSEVYLVPSRWNKLKVFAANSYEMLLITMGLALSVYQEDFFTFVYQFMMQGLLYFSMRDKGAYTKHQVHFSKFIIFCIGVLTAIKLIYVLNLGFELTADVYDEMKMTLETFGFKLKSISENGEPLQQIEFFDTFSFEISAAIVNFLLLKYYIEQSDAHIRKDKF